MKSIWKLILDGGPENEPETLIFSSQRSAQAFYRQAKASGAFDWLLEPWKSIPYRNTREAWDHLEHEGLVVREKEGWEKYDGMSPLEQRHADGDR